MPRPIVIANWKMNFTLNNALAFCKSLMMLDMKLRDQVLIAAPSLYLGLLAASFPELYFAGQDVSLYEKYGPYTGEISASMLKECNVQHTIVGHSERRSHCFENDLTTKRKVDSCLRAGVTPIICIGESFDTRQRGEYLRDIEKHLLESGADKQCILAYEPVWAIGSKIFPVKEQLEEVCEFMIHLARHKSLVYGGSVNSDNISMLATINGLDGLLVGAASLNIAEFVKILEFWINKC